MSAPASRHPTLPMVAHPLANRGFSLIELMVSITITLFLGGAMIAILLSMRSTFTAQDNLVQLQDNRRLAIAVLSDTIHQAGYFVDPLDNTRDGALPAEPASGTDDGAFASGQAISGTAAASRTASDTVSVRFQTANNDELMNCIGGTNTSGAPKTWTNRFAVNDKGQLTCSVGIDGGAPGSAAVLIEDVAAMTIAYGVDTDGDGSIDTYFSAKDMTAARWKAVGALRLRLAFRDLLAVPQGATAAAPRTIDHTVNLMNR